MARYVPRAIRIVHNPIQVPLIFNSMRIDEPLTRAAYHLEVRWEVSLGWVQNSQHVTHDKIHPPSLRVPVLCSLLALRFHPKYRFNIIRNGEIALSPLHSGGWCSICNH
jgi:hypothetical protein